MNDHINSQMNSQMAVSELTSEGLSGRLTKMSAQLEPDHLINETSDEMYRVKYTLKLLEKVNQNILYTPPQTIAKLPLSHLLGRQLSITYLKQITCLRCDHRIKKTYGDGLCFPCFQDAPSAAECVIRPELCRAHEGKGRDPDWEQTNHNQPHLVYMALSSHYKVGVTRDWPTRWIDQGAVAVQVIAETPYRKLAGDIEVCLSQHYRDKIAWQRMLKGEILVDADLKREVARAIELLPENLRSYQASSSTLNFSYPSLEPIKKVKSIKLDKLSELKEEIRGGIQPNTYQGRLIGAQGQYLIFAGGQVINLRAHSGYHIHLSFL